MMRFNDFGAGFAQARRPLTQMRRGRARLEYEGFRWDAAVENNRNRHGGRGSALSIDHVKHRWLVYRDPFFRGASFPRRR